MSRIVGEITQVLEPGYPELSVQDGVATVTVVYTVSADWLAARMPRSGSSFPGVEGYEFFKRFARTTLSSYTVKPKPGGQLYTLTLVYTDDDNDDEDAVVKSEVEYETQDDPTPLEMRSNYRTCWNHQLCAKGTTSIPAWWGTATSEVIPAADCDSYEWIKPGGRARDGWGIIKEETKPGVENRLSGKTIVHVIQRCASLRKLVKSAEKDYTIQTPPKVFNRPGEWLRGGSSITKNGKLWELRVDFYNALAIDRDLYS